FVPYGTGPGSTASFLIVLAFPSAAGLPTAAMVLPNNGLVPSGAGGTRKLLAAASADLPIASAGLCWEAKFTWIASALPTLDDIDGLWHYVQNSHDLNQYWAFSDD